MIRIIRKLSNAGIRDDMQAVDLKILGLMNRVILLSISIFLIFTISNLLRGSYFISILSAFNVVSFSLILFLQAKGFFPKTKHFFEWFGISMITFVNMAMPASVLPQFNYLTGVVFTTLIFRETRPIIIYILLYFVSYLFTLEYRGHYPPLFQMDENEMFVSAAFVPIISIFIVCFGSLMFFRKLNKDYESTLLVNNHLLERQKNEIALQANMLNNKNEKLNNANEELKSTLEQLKEMQGHLLQQEKMASLGQLTAGIAHEINNPVNFVSANVSPLRKDFEDLLKILDTIINRKENEEETELEQLLETYEYAYLKEEINALLAGMEEGAARTKKIVAGLRSFSRSDQQIRKHYNVNKGIEVTLNLLGHRIKQGVNISLELQAESEVWCNPDQINQVLMNIFTNALDAVNENGNLHIQTSFVQKKGMGKSLCIAIKDDGIGMSEAVKRKIFDPFFTTKSIGKGTGLGLSISYGIIRDHQGEIQVTSKKGTGSTFKINLPVES